MAHQGSKACHWCEGCWPKNRAYRRHCFDGHERWLEADNPLRTGDDLAPPDRTPASVARDAKASADSDLLWKDENHPRRASGVNGVSALSLLPLFNIIWDVLPDWMHIIKNLMLPHFLKVVKGKRKLKQPQWVTTKANATPEQAAANIRCVLVYFSFRFQLLLSASGFLPGASYRANDAIRVAHKNACKKTEAFEKRPMVQAIIDDRCDDLNGLAPDWITPGLAPMQHTGAVKAADCRTLLWSAGDYIFYNLFGEKQAALEAWIDILRIVEKSTADFENPDAYAEMAQLKMDVAEALTKFERDWPEQCHCIVAHEVMHVPDSIYRWNSVRNFWAFHLERYTCFSFRFQLRNSASDFTILFCIS